MKLEKKSQMVKIKTIDGSVFRGKVNLNSESVEMERLSDFFTKGTNPFIVIYDVAAHGPNSFFVINKSHIVWATLDKENE